MRGSAALSMRRSRQTKARQSRALPKIGPANTKPAKIAPTLIGVFLGVSCNHGGGIRVHDDMAAAIYGREDIAASSPGRK